MGRVVKSIPLSPAPTSRHFLARFLRLTLPLLAESGCAPLTTPEWVDNLQPQVVLLSVSLKDVTGLPNPSELQAVEEYTVLRTDRNG